MVSQESENKIGKVVAVCLSDKRDYPKYPKSSVKVGQFGIEGDAHAGEFRKSYKDPEKLVSNDRAISIISDEVRQEVSKLLGREIPPGSFNENILISGLGDLSDFKGGEELKFDYGVVLKVTGQNKPCQKLEEYLGQKGVIKALIQRSQEQILNKRGLVATIVNLGEIPTDSQVKVVKE